jgi:hypothetical protein
LLIGLPIFSVRPSWLTVRTVAIVVYITDIVFLWCSVTARKHSVHLSLSKVQMGFKNNIILIFAMTVSVSRVSSSNIPTHTYKRVNSRNVSSTIINTLRIHLYLCPASVDNDLINYLLRINIFLTFDLYDTVPLLQKLE